jgi:protein gp37
MGDKSKIEWTDASWNPTRGCSLVSAGCTNCYAMKVAGGVAKAAYGGLTRRTGGRTVWTGEVRLVPEMLNQPLHWRKPRRIFVDSMSDLFHTDVPDEYIRSVFEVMAHGNWHTYQILTKRPERMAGFVSALREEAPDSFDLGMRHIWLGTSVEDQAAADERIPYLLRTPAAVRFVSCEPLIGPVDLESVPLPGFVAGHYGLRGVAQPVSEKETEPDDWKYWSRRDSKVDWVIVGGESGPNARPCNVGWIRDIVRQCREANVPCFVKQVGSVPFGSAILDSNDELWDAPLEWSGDGVGTYRPQLRDRKGGDPAEWPEDLRVQEYPT